jgi:hypothetical protein
MSQKELRPDSASERGHREGSGRGVSTRHAPQRKRLEASAVVFVILISYAALLVPLGCFLAAAVADLIPQERPSFFLRLGEIAFGVTALWALTRVGQSESRSWTMVCLSLLLGGLALVSKYASQAALFCVLFGGATLAFLWYFKRAYHAQQFGFAVFLLFLLFAAAAYGVFRHIGS